MTRAFRRAPSGAAVPRVLGGVRGQDPDVIASFRFDCESHACSFLQRELFAACPEPVEGYPAGRPKGLHYGWQGGER